MDRVCGWTDGWVGEWVGGWVGDEHFLWALFVISYINVCVFCSMYAVLSAATPVTGRLLSSRMGRVTRLLRSPRSSRPEG